MRYIKKILHIPKLVGEGGFKELKLFDRSIKQISELNIPNTPKFIESGNTDDTIWYSYEYIDGLNLNEYMQQVELTPNMIEYFIIQLLNIQQNLIENDIIHRDIKPSNIIVNNNELYLIDFNTIKSISGSGGTTSILSWGYTPINETLLPNNTTDVYSIGAIWYQMLTGINVVEYAINNHKLDLNLIRDKKTRYILSNMLCNRGSRWNGEQVLDAIQNGVKTKSKSSMRMISPLSIINSILSGIGLSLGLYLESGVMIIISSLVLVSGIASIISSIAISSDDIYDKLDGIKDIKVENPRTYTKTYRE
jgi:serine/threonine protein kinase